MAQCLLDSLSRIYDYSTCMHSIKTHWPSSPWAAMYTLALPCPCSADQHLTSERLPDTILIYTILKYSLYTLQLSNYILRLS